MYRILVVGGAAGVELSVTGTSGSWTLVVVVVVVVVVVKM
jgi:hypothetical protein